MKRILATALCLYLILGLAAAAGEQEGAVIPAALRFTQKTTTENLSNNRAIIRCYPTTALDSVNEGMRTLIDSMTDDAMDAFPKVGGQRAQTQLNVGSYIARTGTRWMSFLTIARIKHDFEQTYMDFDARVYNMESGERISLEEIIDANKGGWVFLGEEVRRQLRAYYPDTTADELILERLCGLEALANTPFTVHPGHLTLHYYVGDLYPGRSESMMNVTIYYSALRPYMTESAALETDCSAYALVALTYDDGPSWGNSDRVINLLREYGADATFFLVGSIIAANPDVMKREHDAGYSVQSHNWEHIHESSKLTTDSILAWRAKVDEKFEEVIGIRPQMMRAPGGVETPYIRAGINMPVIHWSVISGDATSPANEVYVHSVPRMVSYAHDGDIVLCHDANKMAHEYAKAYLPVLEERNMLCVSILDMFDIRGREMPTDTFITDCKALQ